MRIVYFTHSLVSCWNHGNAHFLRGLLRELGERGHDVIAFEPANGWSRQHLVREHGEEPLHRFRKEFPSLKFRLYHADSDPAGLLDGADLVLVHEWIDPTLASAIGELRKAGGRFLLLFHDTHHRAVSDPGAIRRFDLSGYDGVLAFGHSLAEVYRRAGWGSRAFTLHEAADTRLFRPPTDGSGGRSGIVWVGNWGDGERNLEIVEYLLAPAQAARLRVDLYGVRYPTTALQTLNGYAARYHGWIANADVPAVFAQHRMTLHIPRSPYCRELVGIPTIRVFEALACGIPLLCAPWRDSEGLFRPGHDFLLARNGNEMLTHMRAIAHDSDLRRALVLSGLERIRAKHTCAHRADQLLAIVATLQAPFAEAV
jgi:spore maturation protein CgeB